MKTYTGIARNAKAGAALETEAGVFYLSGKSDWEDNLLNQLISVTGDLTEQKYISDPVNDKGEIQQGAWGNQWILTNWSY